MPRTAKVRMGETEYTFLPLTIGQYEDMLDYRTDEQGNYLDDAGAQVGLKEQIACKLAVAQIMFRRATPPIDNVRDLEGGWAALNAAMNAIYRISGMIPEDKPLGEDQAKADQRNLSGSSLAA